MKRDGHALSGALAQPRRLAVLAMLARGGPAGVPRDRLISTLWPDVEEERARHTLNQTLYAIRREIGDDEVIVGMRELRLNTERLAIDVVDFQTAVVERDLQRAAEVYEGPFLDGFHLPGADEFERWSERERSSLDQMYTTVLEQVARDATARGDHGRAAGWWRTRAAHDPLDARVAIALMQSLDAAGERLAAIQHARVYELLIDEELSLPPDAEVVRYAEALRRQQVAAAEVVAAAEIAAPDVAFDQVTTEATGAGVALSPDAASVDDLPVPPAFTPAPPAVTPTPALVENPVRRIRPPRLWTVLLAAASLLAAVALGMHRARSERAVTADASPDAAAIADPAPLGQAVADVTTRSVTAYRMYEQGLKAHVRGERAVARTFFEAAVAEDSLFALAQYYAAVDADDPVESRRRLERARRLANRVSDRERLTIAAGWASTMAPPVFRAIADTLAIRYPSDVAGHLNLGIALVSDGDFLQALGPLTRVMAMDSLAVRTGAAGSSVWTAMQWTVNAYMLADSLAGAERVARRWVRLQPGSRTAVRALVDALDVQGRAAAGDSVLRATTTRVIDDADALYRRAGNFVRAGDFVAAERLIADILESGGRYEQIDAYWLRAISLRQQGRLAEALDATRRMIAITPNTSPRVAAAAPTIRALEAQILLELGRPRASQALFDSIARGREHLDTKATVARRLTWNLTHSATARAAAGDTAGLARMIDSLRALGMASGYGRDRRLHHHVRGLLLVARGDDEGAAAAFRQAISSRNFGYTRTNYELARVLLRLGRPAEAVEVLQPAFRGGLEASNLYISQTELHELLAQAWVAAGHSDSAAIHYGVVANAWRRADPLLEARREQAEARASAPSASPVSVVAFR